MSILAIKNSIYEQRIGALEFRETSTAPLSCFSAFLKWSGVAVNLDMLMDIVPIPTEGASKRQIAMVARQLGILMNPISQEKIKDQLESSAGYIHRTSGYAILLLAVVNERFIAALPGHPNGFCSIPLDSDLFDGVQITSSLHLAKPGPALRRSHRIAKFQFLVWRDIYCAKYRLNDVVQLSKKLAKVNIVQVAPLPLSELTNSALLASHRSIARAPSKYLGNFRTLNLRRSVIFVDFQAVRAAIAEFMQVAREAECSTQEEVLMLATRLFVDFLIIHPFVNANRRMAMLIVSKFMDRWSMGVRWDEISRAQIYFWVRCASNGHVKPLENGLREHMFSLASDDKNI
jgi:fido (protein-threonine AMPylation protein)